MRKIIGVLLAALFMALLLPCASWAAEEQDPRCEISAGVWSSKISGEIRSGIANIDVDKILGMGSNSVFRGAAKFPIGKRTDVEISYQQLKNTGLRTISQQFDYEGMTYLAGCSINSKIEASFIDVNFKRKLSRDPNNYVSLLLGFKLASMSGNLSGTGQIVDKQGTIQASASTSSSVSAPVPELGLGFRTRLSPKLDLYGEALGMSLKVTNTFGSAFDYNVGIKYNFSKNTALDLGYIYSKLYIRDDKQSIKYQLEYTGPHADLCWRF